MVVKSEIIEAIPEIELEPSLLNELLDEYFGLRDAYAQRDYETLMVKATKFCEVTFQLLHWVAEQDYPDDPNFNEISEKLENSPKDELPESIRILIPRKARNLYDLRSKRGGIHKKKIEPLFMDANLALMISGWVVAEFVRLYAEDDFNADISPIVSGLVTRYLPLVEEFEDGDVVILAETESCKQDCLLIFYHFFPNRITNEAIKGFLSEQSEHNVLTSLRNAEKENLIHRNDNGGKLTKKGIEHIEKNFGK